MIRSSRFPPLNQLRDEGVVEMSKPASAQVRPFYSTSSSESIDILHKGDAAKWMRLASVLKAHQAWHRIKRPICDLAAVLLLYDKAFPSTADDAQINFQLAVAPLANTTNIFVVTRGNFGTATFLFSIVKYLNVPTYPGVIDPCFGILTPTTSQGIDPGRGTSTMVSLTLGATLTDFYGSWHAHNPASPASVNADLGPVAAGDVYIMSVRGAAFVLLRILSVKPSAAGSNSRVRSEYKTL